MTAPPLASDAYTDAIATARRRGYRLGRIAQEQLIQAFREAARRIEFDLRTSDNPITRARAESLRQQINAILRELERTTGTTTNTAVRRTVDDVVAIHQRVVTEIMEREIGEVPRETLNSLARVNARAAAVLAARSEVGGGAAGFRTLMKYHRQQAAPALDRLIQSAVARGVSTRRLTRDIADLLANGVADMEPYGVDPSRVSKLGELAYDGRRIAVNETLSALRETSAEAAAASSVIEAHQWQRSGTHHIVCECDLLAEADLYGLGGGWYPVGRLPIAPHILCACTYGAVRLLHPSLWNKPRPPAASLAVDWDTFTPSDYVRGASGWSEKRNARAITALRRSLLDPIGRRARRAA